MHFGFPYRPDGRGRTAGAGRNDHLRDLIEQVLFTTPGERLHRPEFGSGLMQLVFTGNGEEVAAATQFLVQSALQRWLGDVIQVESVDVENRDSTLRVQVTWIALADQARQSALFTREVG